MITNKQKRQFEEDGFFIVKNAISEQQVKKSLKAYERMREKCESYKYIYFRKYADIALNDIYGIEHIFHPEIFEEDIFESIMQCNILEISQELMETEKVFLSRNRLHCTRKISHSGYWHRDGTPSKVLEDIDEMLKKSNGRRTIPQIFFDNNHIGGYQELRVLEKNGDLLNLLK